MSTYNPHHSNAPQVFEAASAWRDRCLREQGSILSDEALWTAPLLEEVQAHFVGRIDVVGDGFIDKLGKQMDGASPSAIRLMAELLWLLQLFPSNVGAHSKRDLVRSVWSWSGEDLDPTHPGLGDEVLGGLGSGGVGFNNHRWREIRFLLKAMLEAKRMPRERLDEVVATPWSFSDWLDAVRDDGNRQLKLMLPHLLFPDYFERIGSHSELGRVLTGLEFLTWPEYNRLEKTDRDRALLELRARLEEERGGPIDFYDDGIRPRWSREEESAAEAVNDADAPQSAAAPVAVSGSRRYWIAGATWDGEDQTPRFRAEGVWRNGWEDRFSDSVRRIEPGDRIAIKSSFVRRHGLPFENNGVAVSANRIKATGTVTRNVGDGVTVEVDWDPPVEPRDWYFYTFRQTLAELDPADDAARRLIAFLFYGAEQDYPWWLARPYHAARYAAAPAEAPVLEEDDSDDDLDEAGPVYDASSIIDEGCFLSLGELERVLAILRAKRNLVLQGPPGTGKTWLAKRLGQALVGSGGRLAQDRVRVVQFHPSLSYEDFVRGWRPSSKGRLELVDGAFLRAVEAALSDPNPFVLVIEEMNRGNPAQIFGELLTLIEGTKRRKEDAIELAYVRRAGERVHVPDNLHIIGTMNLADRSLALVDMALRRRFAFVQLEPRLNEAWRSWSERRGGLDAETLDLVWQRLTALNQEIAKDKALGDQFRVGHSFVTPETTVGDGREWFRKVVDTEIGPLLDEYWFDDGDRAAAARAALLSGL